MKKAGIIFALIIGIQPWMFAQEQDTTAVTEDEKNATVVPEEKDASPVVTDEDEDSSVIIFSDDEDGVNIKLNEFVVEEKRDTTKIKLGDKNINIIENEKGTSVEIRDAEKNKDDGHVAKKKKKFRGHWAGFEMGMNNFFDSDFSISRPPEYDWMDLNTSKSWNVNLNLYQMSFGLVGNRFGLVSGIGIEFNNYKFDGNNSIEKVDGIIQEKSLADLSLDKSKLTTSFLTVPLLLEVQIGPEKRSKRIYISGGVIGGLKLGSHTKYVYRDEGKKEKVKSKNDYNINPLRYGFTLRVGYRNASIYSVYYPISFYEKDKGPELYPFNIGLALGF